MSLRLKQRFKNKLLDKVEASLEKPNETSSKSSSQSEKVKWDRDEVTPQMFQKFVKQRKAEVIVKAEKERQALLRRVEGMNSKTGIDPLSLFPKHIWALILNELKNPQDLANIYQLHSLFRDLLKDNLIRDILFPQVVQCMFPLPHIQRQSKSKEEFQQLLTLRLVSRSLRNAVDLLIEERLLHVMRSAETSLILNTVHLQMTENSRTFTFPKRQQFFLRSLKITISPFNLMRMRRTEEGKRKLRERLPHIFLDFKETTTELLKSMGDQILHFHLDIEGQLFLVQCGVPLGPLEINDLLREWLLLMPNLKWLKMMSCGESEKWNQVPLPPNQMMNMPTLKMLERVDVSSSEKLLVPSMNAVLIANPQIKFHCNRGNACKYTHYSVMALALETVHLEECDLPLLKKISNESKWNLRRVSLEIWRMDLKGQQGQNSVAAVFQYLEKFQSLEDISLRIDSISVEKDIPFLRLPNLRKFKITFGPTGRFVSGAKGGRGCDRDLFFSLQFLWHCSKLETLIWENLKIGSDSIRRHIEDASPDVGRDETMIDFKGGFGDLNGTNVWEVFPKLKRVKVKFILGKREREYFSREYVNRKLVRDSREKWNIH